MNCILKKAENYLRKNMSEKLRLGYDVDEGEKMLKCWYVDSYNNSFNLFRLGNFDNGGFVAYFSDGQEYALYLDDGKELNNVIIRAQNEVLKLAE